MILVVLAALVVGIFDFALQSVRPAEPLRSKPLEIDLSLWALPYYTLLSMLRAFAAYGISLLFTLVYGGIAAKSRRAERIMIPILDILQSIPVLGFLPGLVLGMVALFPNSNIGLELASIIMVFTGQAWNMAFSFYGSVMTVPSEMREVSRLYRLGWWKTFRALEIPFSAIPLVWNSMMSMAGGWFILTVNEAFRLGDKDFRLAGLGSYMTVAIDRDDATAQLGALVAMGVMIIAIDQLLWRPLTAWSHKFKFEEVGGEVPQSWVLNIVRRSRLVLRLERWIHDLRQAAADRRKALPDEASFDVTAAAKRQRRMQVLGSISVVVFALCVGWGSWTLVALVGRLSPEQWWVLAKSLIYTFLRVFACLVIAALWCIPAGVMIGRSPRLSRRLQPIVQLAASYPAPMIYPILTGVILGLGLNFGWACVLLMLLGSQWYVLFNVIAGAQAIPHDMVEAAKVYGLKGKELWRKLLLPAVFPALTTGLITAAGGAWNASIVSELVHLKGQEVTAPGLGSLINKVTEAADFGQLAAAILVLSAALVLVNRLCWKKLYHYADERFALNR